MFHFLDRKKRLYYNKLSAFNNFFCCIFRLLITTSVKRLQLNKLTKLLSPKRASELTVVDLELEVSKQTHIYKYTSKIYSEKRKFLKAKRNNPKSSIKFQYYVYNKQSTPLILKNSWYASQTFVRLNATKLKAFRGMKPRY